MREIDTSTPERSRIEWCASGRDTSNDITDIFHHGCFLVAAFLAVAKGSSKGANTLESPLLLPPNAHMSAFSTLYVYTLSLSLTNGEEGWG